MSQKEEEFPFQEFVDALSDQGDLLEPMRPILQAASQKNIYWTYSAVSTIYEILKSKEEDPSVKCRCLLATYLLITTYQYPVVTLIEVYLLPILQEVAFFRAKKSEEIAAYYFQQVYSISDSAQVKKQSLQFLERATELIFLGATLKPYRTVEVEQLMQESSFSQTSSFLLQTGIKQPKWKWCEEKVIKNCRKSFIDKLRSFSEESEGWAEFLLVNLLQQVKSGKKELLQLRQLLGYGQCYLTSPVINVCEDELGDLGENFEQKRRYLGLLNELVRCGDIEAIIMIKNSQFLPAIAARIGALQGHLGVAQGELLFPEISASKQIKKEFYCDFLRSLENWAKSMPSDYDSEQFNINGIYKFLKEDKKFKFPDNLNLARFQKEAKDNLIKNKQRNDKLIQILERTTMTKQLSVSAPYSKQSHVKNTSPPTLSADNLQSKLKEAQKQLGSLMLSAQQAESALKMLTVFKDNWIGYLQSLNLQQADQEKLQTVVNAGQKCVQQIQLIVPLGAAFTKGKITYKEFKQRIAQSLDFHHDVSKASINGQTAEKKGLSLSRSLIKSRNSQVGKSNIGTGKSNIGISQFGKSKVAGRELRERMKQKSNMRGSKLDMSKIINRSNMSKYTERSRVNRSKYTDKSKYTDRSRLNDHEIHERSRVNQLKSNIPEREGSELQPIKLQAKEASMGNRSGQQKRDEKSRLAKSFKSQELKEKGSQKSKSRMDITQRDNKQSKLISQVKSKPVSQFKEQVKHQTIEEYGGLPAEAKQGKERSSHKSNSRILSRRSHQGSRLKSEDSVNSDQNSISKDSKSKSISRRINELSRTKKMSEIQSQLKKNIEKVDQTIQVNGNVIKQGSLTQKKSDKRSNQFDDFKDGQQDISSIIHSNSAFKNFHNSAQGVFETIKKEKQTTPIIPSKSSPKQSNILLEEPKDQSSLCKNIKLQQSQGIIVNPDLLPMRHSYHRESHIKSTLNKKIGANPQFKQVFSNKYEGLESRQKEERLLRNNEGLRNVIKSPKGKAGKDSITYNIGVLQRRTETQKKIQMYNEYGNFKSAKDIQLQELQQRKNKEINMLRQKIRDLQVQTMTMRTKLVAKDNELRSMKNISIVGSERGFANFTSPAPSNYDRTSQSKSQKGSLRGSSISKRGEQTLFQKQIESGFKQYLQKIKGISFRKSLLKQKCLIHKSDQIQIGCLSQSGQTVLQSSLYITPHRFDLMDFSIAILHDNNLRIKASPEHIKLISLKRQQKIHLTIQILNLPFCLPELEINYKATSEYSSNYHRLTFPLTFNKFCEVGTLKPQSQSQSHILYLRTDDFKLNSKVVKLQKLGDSFANYSVVPPSKQRSQWLVLAKCRYSQSTFNICMNLAEKLSWIEGFLLAGDPKHMNFFICTLKEILDASKK